MPLQWKIRLLLLSAALGLPRVLAGATLTVTNTSDTGPGSLRQAILDSNASVGVLDTIAFAIPGTGVHTIFVANDWDIVSDPVIIDGTTQAGYAGTPLIDLTGTQGNNGLRISAGGSTIRGLAIHTFATSLRLFTNGGNVVERCYIGTNPAQTAISAGNGIYLQSSPGNLIGGPSADLGNLISGSNGSGITVLTSNATTIQSNRIGTDASGTAKRANGSGISIIGSSDVTVGGVVSGHGNLISGNTGDGIYVTDSGNVLIAGNLIGPDVTGTLALGNNFGIDASGLAGSLTIGAPAVAARNVISGNNIGIFLDNGVHDATIQNNYMGTDLAGAEPLPNVQAILLNTLDTTGVLIGGTGPGEGNLIAFNSGSGGSTGAIWNLGLHVTIRGNSIHSNAGLGLDNGNPGQQANDPGDADGGANDGQNFPIVSTVEALQGPQGNGTRVTGVLRSAASTQYTLDFYGSTGCTPRPQDFLEGQTYLGAGQVTTDGTGFTAFDITVPVAITPGDFVSATATDPAGSTSEISQRLPFSVLPTSGPASGGTPVVISGTDFLANAAVTIGGQPASSVVVVNSTQINAVSPALAAGTVNDLTVANTDGSAGTLPKGWVSDFLDVPNSHQFYSFVTILVRNAITAGIGGGLYGVDQATLRQQMAVFLLKAKYGVCYVPPQCTGTFSDVPCPSTFANWIEDLADQGITGGCGAGVYCPQNPVRRDQMAVFLLKAKYGSGYVPPPCTGAFPDVACPSTFADWIEQLAEEAITGGCGGGNYCPLSPNTRGQMAVFITKTFNLQ